MADKAEQLWMSSDAIASGLMEGLTEEAIVGRSSPQFRVGVFRADPYYAEGFGQTGFGGDFLDPVSSSQNQVRHFAAWFAVSVWFPRSFVESKLRELDNPILAKNRPDFDLGLEAIAIGDRYRGDGLSAELELHVCEQ